MIDLRLFSLRVGFEGKEYLLVVRRYINRIEVVRVFEIVDESVEATGLRRIDFNYVSKTPFTFRNVCWALWQNLKYCFKFVFAKVRDF